MDIGSRLVALRKMRGWSQKELARRVGMAPSQMNRYERGQARPMLRTIQRLARGLRVKVRDLFW